METILDKIVQHKIKDLAYFKKIYKANNQTKNNRSCKTSSFINQLKTTDKIQIIAEIKRGSPSKGLFAPDLDIKAQSKKYELAGAGAISVLTDQHFFYGTHDDLSTVYANVNQPILCKDFIIDEIQIDMAKSAGASMILLIAAIHPKKRLDKLRSYALEIGLEVLLEVHSKEELDIALSLNHKLIGINNRDLKTFKTSIEVSLNLIQSVKSNDIYFISESGIQTKEDVERLAQAGFSGVLIGESLIKNGLDGSLIDEITQIRRKK